MNVHQQLGFFSPFFYSSNNLTYLQSKAQSCHLLFLFGLGEGERWAQITYSYMLNPGITTEGLQPPSTFIPHSRDFFFFFIFKIYLAQLYIAIDIFFEFKRFQVTLFHAQLFVKCTFKVQSGCRFSLLNTSQVFETLPQEEMTSCLTVGDFTPMFSRPFFSTTVCAEYVAKPWSTSHCKLS